MEPCGVSEPLGGEAGDEQLEQLVDAVHGEGRVDVTAGGVPPVDGRLLGHPAGEERARLRTGPGRPGGAEVHRREQVDQLDGARLEPLREVRLRRAPAPPR